MRVSALTILFAAAALSAQTGDVHQTDSGKTITVIPNLVVLPTVVRDRKGELVTGLTAQDFVLKASSGRSLDNAKVQTISAFGPAAGIPLTVGVLVDASRSQREQLPDERAAIEGFIDKGLQATDSGFVVQFAKEIELLHDATAERPKLTNAVHLIGTESANFHTADAGDTRDSEGRLVHNGGVSLYDAVYLSADEVTSKAQGRKALIVFTDGIDVGSKETLTDALEAAQRADTVIYAVYFRNKDQQRDFRNAQNQNRRAGFPGGGYPGGGYPGGGYPGSYPGGNNPNNPNSPNNPNNPNNPNSPNYDPNNPNNPNYPNPNDPNNPNGTGNTPNRPAGSPTRKPSVDGHQVLERLCGETGGAVFEVSKRDSIDAIVAKIGEELRAQYRLGFLPDAGAAKDGYHQIDLELTGERAKQRLDIQVRSGYYVGSN
jgi:VWFA-related protein